MAKKKIKAHSVPSDFPFLGEGQDKWHVNREQPLPSRDHIEGAVRRKLQEIEDRQIQAEVRQVQLLGQGPVSRAEMIFRVLDAMTALEGNGFSREQVRVLKANFRRDLSSAQQPFDTSLAYGQIPFAKTHTPKTVVFGTRCPVLVIIEKSCVTNPWQNHL